MNWKRSLWLAGVLMGALAANARAIDVLQASSKVYKLLFENNRVRVVEGTFKPGDKIPMHTHPDHFVYVVSGGKLKLTKMDGTSSVVDVTPGQVLWINAESHASENTGTTTVKLVVNELKEPAPSTPAAVPAK